jgi:hypothetical protein
VAEAAGPGHDRGAAAREAHEIDGEPQQVVFSFRDEATLVTADREPLLDALERLAELPIERVIIPHGDPVLADGSARIRAAVAEARGG